MRSKLIVIAALVAITMLIVHAAATANNEDLISLTEGAYTGYVGMKHTIAWAGSDDSRFKIFEDAPSETQITTDPSDQKNPAISGDYVVWQDYRTGVDIYMYDLSTRTEAQITTDPAYQWGADISRDRIVWKDLRNGNGDIYMYDISTSTETQITTDPDPQLNPAIYGDRIVYENNSEYIYADDIYMYNLSTGTETQITAIYSDKWYVDIYGDRIVWMDSRNGNWDIYMYDISTGTETQITTTTLESQTPAIYGDRIVWADFRNGNGDIYMYDISTGTETQITTDPDHQWNPAIYGDRIVWADSRNGNGDIYMYDISTGTETQITTDPATQALPAISRDCIVWNDDRNGNLDIYMYTVGATTDPFYYYPTTTFPGEKTELTVIVDLTEIAMNIGDPVQWYITKPGGETVTGESDTLKCCLAGGLYDTAFYDFPDYGMYTIKVEFPGYTAYAEWDVEVWGPTGAILGEVTNPTDDPIENVDVYLYAAEDEYKVLDFIDEWRSDPTTSVPSYISTTKTDSTGNYQITEIIPGSYLVLAVPQVDMAYLPKTSDVYPIEKDETEIINLQLEPKVRWLSELDDVMENIRDISIETVDNNTRAAADVYVDGYKTFYDPNPDVDWSKLLSVVLSTINLAMDITNPTATVGKVKLACNGYIANNIVVPIAEHGIDLAIADHWWNVRGTTFQDKMSYYSNQVNSTTWMKEFYPNTVSSPEDALQNGYYTTPMYINGLSLINASFEDYNKTIAYADVPSDFSLSQTENVLRNQVFWLHDKTDGETKIADGIIITPTGNVYLFKLAQAHRDGYNNAKLEMGVAKAGQTISEVTSTCGNYISFKGACTLNPHAVGIGMTVQVIGWAGGIAFNSYEIYAKNKVAKQWAYTQIYWAQDLDTIPQINRDIVEWLESETQDPRLPHIDGNIVDTDLHLLQIPLTNKNIAFANEPNYPWWWIFPRLRWWILNTNTVTIESTSSIDSVKTRILCIDRYGNELVSEMPTIHPNETEPPMLMDRYETETIDLPYTGDFQIFNPFHWHYLSTILWMEGKQPDMETDVYYVIPLSFSPLPYTIPGKTTMLTQEEVNTLLKQPMGSEVCAFTTKETKSDSSITLEDWGNLLGNCTKIIDTSLDPFNDSTQVQYTSNASITDVTFLMTTIPGSHLNLHVYDELGRHVGYFPATDSDQIQIPNATYTGNISNPEIILVPNAASKNYTIKVDATQFTTSSPIPVEVYAIETPVRPAVLGISPVVLYPFISPGETENITMQLAEVGQQEDIEGVTILPHNFTDKFGNVIPDVTAIVSQSNFDICAGNTTYLTITINVPKNITLPDMPETRYTGNITIETVNAGNINSSIHLLVLDTNLTNAKLAFAELNVTGVHLSSIDLSGINETYKPAEVTPESAYMINSTGAGNFTLKFTDIPNADLIRVYKIDHTSVPPNQWIKLDTTTTDTDVTFMMSAGDPLVVFAKAEPLTTLYYPDFTDTDTPGNWRTWLGVMNTGDTSTTPCLDVYNPDGSLAYSNPDFVTLEPKAVHFFRPGITAGIAQGSAIVYGDNLAGTCHVNKNGGEGTKVYTALRNASSKLYYPDFTDTDTIGNWRTWIAVMNAGNTSTTVRLDVYNTDGSVAYSNANFVTLEPKAVHFFRPGITAGIAQGSVVVSGDSLAGTCHVNKNGGEGTKAYPAVSGDSAEALDISYKSSELKKVNRARYAALARAPVTAELARFEPITFPARVAYDNSAPKKAFAGDSGYDRFEIRSTPPISPVDLETVKICLWPDWHWPDSETFTTVSPAATEVIQPPKQVRVLSYTLNETENGHRLSKPTRQREVLGDPTTSDVTLQSSLDTQTITIDNVSNSFPMFSNAEYVNFTIENDTITLILDVNASFDGVCNLSTLMGREVSVAGSTAELNYTPISYQTGNYDQKWASDPYFDVTEHKLYLLSGSGWMPTFHLELKERSTTAIPKVVGIGDLVCAMNIATTAEKTNARYNNLTSHMTGVGYADLYIQYAPDVTYDTTPYLPVFTHCERLEAHNITSLMNGSGSSQDYNVYVLGLAIGAAPISRELDVCNLSLNFDLEYFPITYQNFSADQKWQLLPSVNETEHRLYLLSGSGIITSLNLTLNENSTTTPIPKVVGVGDLVGNYHIEVLAQGSNSSDNHLASRIVGVGYADLYAQYAPDTTYESTPFMPVFMQCEALEAPTINSIVNGSWSSVEYQVDVLGMATGMDPIPVVADTWNSTLDFDVEYFPITYQDLSFDQKWYFIPSVNETEHRLYLLSGSGIITSLNLTLNENSTTTPIPKVVGVGALVGNFRIEALAQGANSRDNHFSSRIVGVGYADLYAQYAPDTSYENVTFIPTFSQCEHLQMSTNTAGAGVAYDAHVLGLANGVDYLEFNNIPLDSVAINGTFDLAYHPVNVSGEVFDEEWSFTPWQYNTILVLLRGTGNVTQLNFTFNDTTSAYPEITSYGYLSGDYDITTTILPHYMNVIVNGTNVTAMDESGQGGFGITFAPPPKIIYPDFTDTDTIGNWRTWLGVMNTGDTSTTLCLDVYNTDGSVAYSNSDFVTLGPKAAHFFRPGMTAGIPQGSAVVSGDNLAGTCHVNKNGGEGTKAYTALSSGSSTLNYPDFTDTDTSGNWRTWMGVMNTGATSTTVRLDVYNPDGSLAYSNPNFVTLEPKAVHFFRPGITAGIAQGDAVVSGDNLAGTCHVNKNGGEGTKVYTAMGD